MSTLHALIIDDDVNNLEVLAELLNDAGVSHTALQDAKELDSALEGLQHIDVVFLDLELPGLNGYDLLDILKNEIGINAPIIAYTVHSSEAVNARRMGFDGFIPKPLDSARFPDQLRRILNGETVWDTR
jgi:two-component system cell cycle response regulator DivK